MLRILLKFLKENQNRTESNEKMKSKNKCMFMDMESLKHGPLQ